MIVLLVNTIVFAQDVVQSDSLITVSSDTVSTELPDTLAKPVERIIPLVFSKTLGHKEVTTDSLLRWQIWPSWGDWYSRQEDVISYRQGTIARIDAYLIDGIEPRYQSLKWNGISFNDPVSGAINFNEVPHHKLSSVTQQKGLGYENELFFKNYYITKPVTQLNFDESKFDYRNLEFVFSRNFTQRTNLELSFWDRRDGDAFQRSDVQGSQVFGRAIHHFNNKWALQATYLRNQYARQESFGYQLPDNLATFGFGRFTTLPVVNNGNSDPLTSIWSASLHKRKKGAGVDDFTIGIHRKRIDNELTYTADTTFYEIKNIGLRADKRINAGKFDAQFSGGVNHYNAPDTSSISISSWTEWNGAIRSERKFSDSFLAGFNYNVNGRDGDIASGVSLFTVFKPVKKVELNFDGSVGTKLPTIQQLHWESRLYSGNENLQSEFITSVGGEVIYKPSTGWQFGAKGRYRAITDGIILGLDDTFTNVSAYDVLSATAYGSYNVKHWEGSLSGTFTEFMNSETQEIDQRINAFQPNILLKGSAYIKGTIYNGATFVKAGFAGTFSPNLANTYSYVPDLGYWRLISGAQQNPSYFRLDFDFSARLRSIFIVMRFENILDGLAQAGYFESVGYPLPPRRFITGIRVLFRN